MVKVDNNHISLSENGLINFIIQNQTFRSLEVISEAVPCSF